MIPQFNISFGMLLDHYAADTNRPEVRTARSLGLRLFYFFRPHNKLQRGRIDIIDCAKQADAKAVTTGKPAMLVFAGDKTPAKFVYPREIEVATVIAWPDGSIWARIGVLVSRSTSEQKAFVCSTGLHLPVSGKQFTRLRIEQGRAVAIATVATIYQMPLPDYPLGSDRRKITAHDVAEKAGLAVYLQHWH
jgi:hypothetical protein